MKTPVTSSLDLKYSAPLQVAALMRRVMLGLMGTGFLATLAVWSVDAHSGLIEPLNRLGFPILTLIFGGSFVALWRWPQAMSVVRWLSFLSFSGWMLSDLALQVLSPAPLLGNYNVATLVDWLPLTYAVAFLMFRRVHAVIATGLVFAFLLGCIWLRVNRALPTGAEDASFLLNVLLSNVVLVTCLSAVLWLKRLVYFQGMQAEQLSVLAGTDPLTGLANRRRTMRILDSLPPPSSANPAVVLLADLDYFKRINDGFGHAAGDLVLQATAAALRKVVRKTDTIARWGGEEFLVILPGISVDEASALAARACDAVRAMTVQNTKLLPDAMTISIGMAVRENNETTAEWLRRADEALYHAKETGRDRFVTAPAAYSNVEFQTKIADRVQLPAL